MKQIKHILLFALMSVSLTAWAAKIPAGSTIYLDVTQHWCCQGSYYVYLSSGSTSYVMTPVPGMDAVYEWTTLTATQENLRFCYTTTPATTPTVSGQQNPHTNDVKGWSAAAPYYVMDSEDGKNGHWASAPSTVAATALTAFTASVSSMDCRDSAYSVSLTVTFEGVPCGLRLQSDLLTADKVVKTPSSPFTYTIRGVKTTGTDTVRVFLCSDAACLTAVDSAAVAVQSPEMQCEKTVSLTVCVGSDTTIRSSAGDAEFYRWSNGAKTDSVTLSPTAEGEETLVCRAYKTVLRLERNLMAGGDFETENTFTSDYAYVGKDLSDYYTTHGGASNLYTLTDNANVFWRDYAPVTPHGGNYFGLFDAGKDGYAWKATTADNPALSLLKDSVYLFSYWAAYPNITPDHSPAELQFVIRYVDYVTGVTHTENLGTSYTLGQEDDMNGWYQQTVIWQSPAFSVDVMIGVYDINTASSGNDFCLDDIMFQTARYSESEVIFTDTFHITYRECGCTGPDIYRKWDDFLFVDNSDSLYVAYQWYHDGAAIAGATDQYYRVTEAGGPSGTYHVEMTCADGSVVSTCPRTFAAAKPSATLYPATAAGVAAVRTYDVSDHFRIVVTYYEDGTVFTDKQIIR